MTVEYTSTFHNQSRKCAGEAKERVSGILMRMTKQRNVMRIAKIKGRRTGYTMIIMKKTSMTNEEIKEERWNGGTKIVIEGEIAARTDRKKGAKEMKMTTDGEIAAKIDRKEGIKKKGTVIGEEIIVKIGRKGGVEGTRIAIEREIAAKTS